MTGNRSKLKNFVENFIGIVRFGNDHFGAIMGYGYYVIGDSVISRVYCVEGLGHNLFSVGQFCDSDLEMAFRKHSCFNTMAEQNVPPQPPTRTDEQIVPRSQWLIIRKSNLLFNAQKFQKNPIFQISVDILSNTNFFRAFTASASVPAIYLQQFWNTMIYNEKSGIYSCQIDEQWFDLSADLLRKALAITPVIPAQPFELPPSGNTVIDFVNELGYPEPIEIISNC
ncbi:hypothetical protein Tco_0382076 [Tanacetum coccineum]